MQTCLCMCVYRKDNCLPWLHLSQQYLSVSSSTVWIVILTINSERQINIIESQMYKCTCTVHRAVSDLILPRPSEHAEHNGVVRLDIQFFWQLHSYFFVRANFIWADLFHTSRKRGKNRNMTSSDLSNRCPPHCINQNIVVNQKTTSTGLNCVFSCSRLKNK